MKSKTRKELATAYGVTVKTFLSWVALFMEIPERRAFWPKEVAKIYEELGAPEPKK